MSEDNGSIQVEDVLNTISARRCLEDINRYLLHGEGEIVIVPGKISLIWVDPLFELRRYLAVKALSNGQVLINGQRYPATEAALKTGLIDCLKTMR